MAARTWSRVSGRMCGSSFTTRETVLTETPARTATSRIVTRMRTTLARRAAAAAASGGGAGLDGRAVASGTLPTPPLDRHPARKGRA
nr:hypothetical protein GCM10025732_32720 [Glycomyces mayteni]